MTVKLIGNDVAGTAGISGARVWYAQFTCEVSGTCSEVWFYSLASGYIKAGVYADNGSDYPGNRLAKRDTGQAVTADQWNAITLEATCELVADTKYWLVGISDVHSAGCVVLTPPGVNHWIDATYSTYTFPATAEADMTLYTSYPASYQGYGTTGGAGWTGEILGVTNPAKINGIAVANISKVNGVS